MGYRSSFPAGLPLRVLEHVNVLGVSLDLEVVALHFVMQRQEVEGVPAGAPRLEVCNYILGHNLGVQRAGVVQFADPGVSNDGKNELCCFPSRRFVCSTIGTLCLVGHLGARMDDGHSAVVYGCIVGPDSCGMRERLTIASDVKSLRTNKADEVVDGSRFVIRDLK